jgi:hypothetical protein
LVLAFLKKWWVESHEKLYSMNNNEFTVKSYYCEEKNHFWDINRMSEYLNPNGQFFSHSMGRKMYFSIR